MKPYADAEKWYSFFCMLREMYSGNFSYRLQLSDTEGVYNDFVQIINLMASYVQPGYPYEDADKNNTMLFVLNDDFFIRETNKAVNHIFGKKPGYLNGKAFSSLLSPNGIENFRAVQLLLSQGTPLVLKTLHYRNGPAEIPAICCFYRSPVHEVVYVTSKEYTTGEDPLDKMLNREMEAVEHHIVHKKRENDKKRIRELAEYIENHYDKPLPPLKELSKTLGVNRQKLKTEFKYIFGKTIYEFYMDRRMEKAREYVCHTDMSNLEIAEKLGYMSESGFYRAFQHKYGCTPNAMRKKN